MQDYYLVQEKKFLIAINRLFPTKYLDNIPTTPGPATEPEVATKKQKHKLNAKDLH